MRLINKPVLCNYYLTYRCNASCSFCDIWERPSPYIKEADVRSNLIALKKMGVRVIDFTGGEPLLHQDLAKFLQVAKEMGFITTVTTNALLYPKRAKELQGKIDMLHFSLDYYNKEKHDKSRGVPCYDKVMESMELALDLGERPDILMTVFGDNMEDIAPIYHQICLPNRLVLILNPAFDYKDIKTTTFNKIELEKLSAWGKKKGIYLNQAFLKLRENGGNQVSEPVCKAASTTVVISPENKIVLPCYHLGLKEFEIDGKLEELYLSEEVQALVALEGRLPACQGCTINCYMQPSFAVEINKYFWHALPSTLKYNWEKGTWKQLF